MPCVIFRSQSESLQFETSYPQQIIDMKPITAIIVFFSLMFPALFLGYNNYAEAKENIIKDVNQALAKTVIYKMPTKITADTLQVFKSNLQINQLKETSYLSLCTEEPSRITFCSDTVSFKTKGERLYIRAYPNCSKATIFDISEQSIPGALLTIIKIILRITFIAFGTGIVSVILMRLP